MDNAVKYSHGRADVEIFCHASGAGGAVIEVKDHGIGMSAEQQKRIFDKFYRIPRGNIHEVKGYGLGLFYVRSIVEKHGWEISVRSSPGKGSVFTIIVR